MQQKQQQPPPSPPPLQPFDLQLPKTLVTMATPSQQQGKTGSFLEPYSDCLPSTVELWMPDDLFQFTATFVTERTLRVLWLTS